MPKVSVIVAIYKVDPYLEECIDSLLKQTLQDIEIILVDDGSPDECPMICDRYGQIDKRIRVIHQKNQGVVMARYNGLQMAKGTYVSFIDGDDWCEPDMYDTMIRLSDNERADIVLTGYFENYGESVFWKKRSNNVQSGKYIGENLRDIHGKALFFGKYYEPGIVPALWNKLFKRELLLDLGVKHPHPLIRMGEDAAVSYPAIERAKYIVVDNNKHLYHYRLIPSSMSKAYDDIFFKRALLLLDGLKHSLLPNSIMSYHLIYYGMFISQIGINNILSKKSTLSILSKRRVLREYNSMFIKLDLGDDVDWELFTSYEKRFMQKFLYGNIDQMIAEWIFERVKRRLCLK